MIDEEILFEKALKKWGFEAQLEMVVEECAELIVAIKHAQRKKNKASFREREDNIIEEAVDVGLMLDQLKVMIRRPLLWKETRERKLKHLEGLLEEEK